MGNLVSPSQTRNLTRQLTHEAKSQKCFRGNHRSTWHFLYLILDSACTQHKEKHADNICSFLLLKLHLCAAVRKHRQHTITCLCQLKEFTLSVNGSLKGPPQRMLEAHYVREVCGKGNMQEIRFLYFYKITFELQGQSQTSVYWCQNKDNLPTRVTTSLQNLAVKLHPFF